MNPAELLRREQQTQSGATDEFEAKRLFDALFALRREVQSEANALFESFRPAIERRVFVPSARNLAEYVVFRRRDLRALQTRLAYFGLSSLGRGEPRLMPTLDSLLATLGVLAGQPKQSAPIRPSRAQFNLGQRLLNRNTRELFGPAPVRRAGRIMVTLPTTAASDAAFVHDLAARGANCFRINCAHDDAATWAEMLQNVRRAGQALGRRLPIVMDIAGPKLRIACVSAGRRRVHVGDRILLERECCAEPSLLHPLVIGVSEPAALDGLHLGGDVLVDDGKLRAKVEAEDPRGFVLRVVGARERGEKLRVDKSVNLPGVPLNLPPLTAKDRTDLDFVARHADIVGYSFVQSASDVDLLSRELGARAEGRVLPLLLKIETEQGVRRLPEIIVAAAGLRPAGVMIARGDLAVEIGYRRLAEIQEEILWICEAAHVPVVWATQVLEHLVKKGLPTRAEITDAAMSERAECVMLNKGPYVADAVDVLDDVLARMAAHTSKKTPTLRPLHF